MGKKKNVIFYFTLQGYLILREKPRRLNYRTYLRVASALSIVTLSLVASRFGRPRSKYLISNSRKGKISCVT